MHSKIWPAVQYDRLIDCLSYGRSSNSDMPWGVYKMPGVQDALEQVSLMFYKVPNTLIIPAEDQWQGFKQGAICQSRAARDKDENYWVGWT